MADLQPMQFDRAEFGTSVAAGVVCSTCKNAVVQSYYEANGNILCSHCRERAEQRTDGGRGGRVLRATAAGLAAAVAGSLVWWGVRKATGYEIGIISIGIGAAVGQAVSWGARARGGWAYQLLAVLLTYAAVAGNYMPDVLTQILEQQKDASKPAVTASATPATSAATPAAAAKPKAAEANVATGWAALGALILGLGALFVVAAMAPFSASNAIGLFIIAFGLREAWRRNKAVAVTITGPFSVAPGQAAPAPNV
jgi:hypothetical protein